MKILQVHNRYRLRGGEDAVFEATTEVLRKNGVIVRLFEVSSQDVKWSFVTKLKTFLSSIYSFSAAWDIERIIADEKPDIVHVHNVYPLLSASVLSSSYRAMVPVVMTFHNYRYVCPIGTHFIRGRVCNKCLGGREYWCLINNCRNRLEESTAYAIRSIVARKYKLFSGGVSCFIAPSHFLKNNLVSAGFRSELIEVIPHMISPGKRPVNSAGGKYVAYVGRISEEKGISTLLEAARRLPDVAFAIAGAGLLDPMINSVPKNVTFMGFLNSVGLEQFYRNARIVVVPSVWWEVFGMVAVEAMSIALPVVASRIGALPEIVDDGVTGFLVQPENPEDLVSKIAFLWQSPNACLQMGQAGRLKAELEYSEEAYYRRLMFVYGKALQTGIKPEKHAVNRDR